MPFCTRLTEQLSNQKDSAYTEFLLQRLVLLGRRDGVLYPLAAVLESVPKFRLVALTAS